MTNILKPPCDEAVIRCTETRADSFQAKRIGPWVLVATILGSSMAFIDGTVVNVALPVLQRDLHATVVDAQWVVEAYALFLSALILVGGSLGDHFGRKRIFALGITLFTGASVLCGLSPNVKWLILARALQGIGGALLIPGSLAIISASFDSRTRGQAIGTWSGFTAITSAIGPVLGGWLVEHAGWRWIFFLNVPLAGIVLGVLLRVPESRSEKEKCRKLDGWGALLVTLGLGGVVYGLIEAGNTGFSQTQTLTALLAGVIALAAFFMVEMRSDSPMLPLNLFRSPTFTGTNLLTFFLYGALGASLFFVPFNLIGVQGYSPTAAGAANLPLILILFFLSRWSGGLVPRYGAKRPLIIGPLIAALGFGLLAGPGIGGGSYWTTFFPAFVVLGIGMAISVAPLTTTVMESVEVEHAGIASGINNAIARTAGLLAIAVLGLVALMLFSTHLKHHPAVLNLPGEAQSMLMAQQNKLLNIDLPSGLNPAGATSVKQAIAESFIASFRILMQIAAFLALASSFCALLLIDGGFLRLRSGGEVPVRK